MRKKERFNMICIQVFYPDLYPSFVVIVVAINANVRKRLVAQTFDYYGIRVSVNKITQEVAILFYLRINQCL